LLQFYVIEQYRYCHIFMLLSSTDIVTFLCYWAVQILLHFYVIEQYRYCYNFMLLSSTDIVTFLCYWAVQILSHFYVIEQYRYCHIFMLLSSTDIVTFLCYWAVQILLHFLHSLRWMRRSIFWHYRPTVCYKRFDVHDYLLSLIPQKNKHCKRFRFLGVTRRVH